MHLAFAHKIRNFLIFSFILGGIIVFFINIAFPVQYLDIIEYNSKKYNLEPHFICAIIRAESNFSKIAVSKKGAKGLMQIMNQTAVWISEELDINNFETNMIFEPYVNIEFGTWYIKNLLNQYNNNYEVALAAYNAGSGNISKWLNDLRYSSDGKNLDFIPFAETRKYVQKIKIFSYIYKIILIFY